MSFIILYSHFWTVFRIFAGLQLSLIVNKTADYINYDSALRKGTELMKNDKTSIVGFYLILSINLGLRVSDILSLRHSDLSDKKEKDVLSITEKKTGKVRNLTINNHIVRAYENLVDRLKEKNQYEEDGFIFISQKKKVYTNRSLNRILKNHFRSSHHNISTHSLRKSFGRKVYENSGQSDHSLILLSDVFRHSSTSITRKYLGLRKEEVSNIYLSL